mgnify:CR=1 FL=1
MLRKDVFFFSYLGLWVVLAVIESIVQFVDPMYFSMIMTFTLAIIAFFLTFNRRFRNYMCSKAFQKKK